MPNGAGAGAASECGVGGSIHGLLRTVRIGTYGTVRCSMMLHPQRGDRPLCLLPGAHERRKRYRELVMRVIDLAQG